jgi:putative membrane protein
VVISWPAFNATLNALCGLCLVTGFIMIRQKKVHHHRICMGLAFLLSTTFLVSYLLYHAQVGSVRYMGQGLLRTAYFVILISHSILAMIIVPLVLRTLYLAFKARFDSHRRLARWTFPIWLYVSVTGVVIYEMLY